jgi:RNA polymerase primary sigma factor
MSDAYFHEIAQHPLLRADEEVELAQQIQRGTAATDELNADNPSESLERHLELEQLVALGRCARAHLIESNLRLVVSIARPYVGHGLSLLDLVQEGNLGLQRAVEKYDWRLGYRFSTYAHWWIRQSVLAALREQGGGLRLPSNVAAMLGDANRIGRRLLLDLGREPLLEEIGAELKVEPARLAAARQAGRPALLLGMPVQSGDDDDRSVGDGLVDESAEFAAPSAAEGMDLSQRLGSMLEELAPPQCQVLRLRFGLGDQVELSAAEVASEMLLSIQQVRQLESMALGNLRRMPRVRRELAEYIGDEHRSAA